MPVTDMEKGFNSYTIDEPGYKYNVDLQANRSSIKAN